MVYLVIRCHYKINGQAYYDYSCVDSAVLMRSHQQSQMVLTVINNPIIVNQFENDIKIIHNNVYVSHWPPKRPLTTQ